MKRGTQNATKHHLSSPVSLKCPSSQRRTSSSPPWATGVGCVHCRMHITRRDIPYDFPNSFEHEHIGSEPSQRAPPDLSWSSEPDLPQRLCIHVAKVTWESGI